MSLAATITPTTEEKKLDADSFVVSRTDTTGKIRYANRTFMEISGYPERELLGRPHNIIRHPDMPRGMFHLLWREISAGREFFMFIKNLCKDGAFYWVFANISPDFADDGRTITGYYSVRRAPPQNAIRTIEPLYAEMRRIEENHDRRQGASQSAAFLEDHLTQKRVKYEKFVLDLYQGHG